MSCFKYTLVNTGSTRVNFNYRKCSDSMWDYQVELEPNQVKNIWVMGNTYSTAFQTIEITYKENFPPSPTKIPTNDLTYLVIPNNDLTYNIL